MIARFSRFQTQWAGIQMYSYVTSCLTHMQTKHSAITVIKCVNGHQTTLRNREVPQEVRQLLTACCIRIGSTSELYLLLISHHCSSAMQHKLNNKAQMSVVGLIQRDGFSRLGLTSEWECPDKMPSWKPAVPTTCRETTQDPSGTFSWHDIPSSIQITVALTRTFKDLQQTIFKFLQNLDFSGQEENGNTNPTLCLGQRTKLVQAPPATNLCRSAFVSLSRAKLK